MSIMAKIIVLTASLFFAAIIVCQDEFVVQKKQHNSSVTSLKSTCSDGLMAGVKVSPYHLQKIARVQDISMTILEQMLEDTFWVQATKQNLVDDKASYKKFCERQAVIDDLLQEQLDFLQAQQKKYNKNNNVVVAAVAP